MIRSLAGRLRRIHDLDRRWTDELLGRTPFHSGFWVRRRLDAAVASCASLASGVLLDVGCGDKRYVSVFGSRVAQYWGLDYSPDSGYRGNRADVYGDAGKLPIRSATIDTVIATELLEHVPNPEGVIAEFARVLSPGGTVICTTPFFYPTHDRFDFFRFGPAAVATLMERHGLEVVEVRPLSGSGLTVVVLFNLFWFDLGFQWTPWLYPLGILLRPVLWLILAASNLLAWLLERAIPTSHMSFNHLTVGRKRLPSRDEP